jgi:CHAT domain-containing protein
VPSSGGGHPDSALLAAHAERRLAGSEAAQLDAHLAECSSCYEVYAETVQFVLADEAVEEPPAPLPRVLPFHRRPAFQIGVGLAAAAGLLLAVWHFGLARAPRPSSPLAELARAMGATRFIEPRVTGGFEHGRLVIMRSGDTTQGLDAHSPAVIAAVAHIRERSQGDTSPEALGALAVTYLVSGDVSAAVKALESATAQDPKNPKLQSDLAAAYLVRATRLDEPSDIPKGLEAAEKSIEQPNAPVEAWFNRALALEHLHLVDAARKAWDDYLKLDSTSPWAAEAKKRRDELPPAQQSTLEEDRARAKAALAEGKAAVDKLADESPSILRDYFDNVLLYAWADAYLAKDPKAAALKGNAELVGDALLRTTGDAMSRDAALALSQAPSGTSRDPPRSQALGYTFLREAQRLADAAQHPKCNKLRESRLALEMGRSPFSLWARERYVRHCLLMKHGDALAELDRLAPIAEAASYFSLLGRAHWLTAHVFSDRSDVQRSLDHYQQARDIYVKIRDPENESAILARRAYVLQAAGDGRAAWRERVQGLAMLDRVRQLVRREAVLFGVANACSQQRLMRCALQMQSAVVDAARQTNDLPVLADSLAWRSALYGPDRTEAALSDLEEARRYLPRLVNTSDAEYVAPLIDASEARVLAASQPDRAIAMLENPIGQFERSRPRLIPGLRLTRARCLLALGKPDEAAGDLEAGIRMLESQRMGIRSAALQASVFDEGASLFDEMVALQLDKRHDAERALYFLERSRGRQLSESLLSITRGPSKAAKNTTPIAPLTPEAIRHALPPGVALVYYASGSDRLVSWVVTQGGSQVRQLPLSSGDVERQVATYEAALDGASPVVALREKSAVVFDALVRPLLPALHSEDALLFIPDHRLQSVPFAGLWDRESGRYLVEDYLLGTAPSGTAFVRAAAASAGTARHRPSRLLAIGNPQLERSNKLPDLPRAELEATTVAGLYAQPRLLTAKAATKAAFLAGLRTSEVVHFSGHAVPGNEAGEGMLLFAPDADASKTGPLYPNEIDRTDLRATRVVVLAGCRTGIGATSRLEGALSLARPFLAAGVPSVVASLRDLDDDVSRDFSIAYHRALLTDGDSAEAVRQAQLEMLYSGDATRAHPSSWAGFVNVGGFNHHPGALREARSR